MNFSDGYHMRFQGDSWQAKFKKESSFCLLLDLLTRRKLAH